MHITLEQEHNRSVNHPPVRVDVQGLLLPGLLQQPRELGG